MAPSELIVVHMTHTRLKVTWSRRRDLYFGFCHEHVWDSVLILDSFFSLRGVYHISELRECGRGSEFEFEESMCKDVGYLV